MWFVWSENKTTLGEGNIYIIHVKRFILYEVKFRVQILTVQLCDFEAIIFFLIILKAALSNINIFLLVVL
jgi:hypothetical protein